MLLRLFLTIVVAAAAATNDECYRVLGVSPHASQEEMKSAYLSMARKWHPDRHHQSKKKKADVKMREINAAWDLCSHKTSTRTTTTSTSTSRTSRTSRTSTSRRTKHTKPKTTGVHETVETILGTVLSTALIGLLYTFVLYDWIQDWIQWWSKAKARCS